MEHNAEHANEFRAWGERARAVGEERLAAHIEAAAQKMEAANHDLEDAAGCLVKPGDVTVNDHMPVHHDHSH
jgi:hypothetical protein